MNKFILFVLVAALAIIIEAQIPSPTVAENLSKVVIPRVEMAVPGPGLNSAQPLRVLQSELKSTSRT